MASPAHAFYCFEVLSANFEKRPPRPLAKIEEIYHKHKASSAAATTNGHTNGHANGHTNGHASGIHSAPLFVTWNRFSKSGPKYLRGCIGTFEAQLLDYGLKTYALTSALEDTRFNPITLKELPKLECAVTILTDFEPAEGPMAWEIGTHGLRISFVYHGRRMGATYLPDVAKEQGWTKEETLVSLMRKAGWTGKKDDWNKVQLDVVTYRGTKASVTWEEYRGLFAVEEDEEEDGDEDEGDEDEEE
ncbi:AMMECR1 domain-containing protein [Tuber brumale]|nr:AMMECR1 domain-containing protein [Tuber brumale]